MTINRKQSINKIILNFSCLIPDSKAVLILRFFKLCFQVENSTFVVPGVRKAIHNDYSVRTYNRCSFLHLFNVSFRRIRRCQFIIEKFSCTEVRTICVKLSSSVFCVDKCDLVPVIRKTECKIQRR